MTTVGDLTAWLEQFAPAQLAELWDNVGLLLGDPDAPVERVMTCLTVTPMSADEAIRDQVGLIISHHPVLFREVKKIRADFPETGYLWKLARAGIAIASPHTAFDNTREGINDLLCKRLGLVDVAPLRAFSAGSIGESCINQSFKIVVFTPEAARETVLSAAFTAGAGRIGAYEECSFAIPGEGTFFGTENTNPAVGERGRRMTVPELRLEVVCPGAKLAQVLQSIRGQHPYEEPAIDVYPLHATNAERSLRLGAGRIGNCKESSTLRDFSAEVSRMLGGVAVGMAGNSHQPVRRVAVACGAGDDFLTDAARARADVLLTGEARFHRALEAESLGIGLITAGHYATERPGVEELAQKIAAAFPTVTVWPSRDEKDPVRLVQADKS